MPPESPVLWGGFVTLNKIGRLDTVRFGKKGTLFTDEDITDNLPAQDRICNFAEQIA